MVVRETGGPEALRLETVPDPAPAPGEVVLEVLACGVCFHDVVTRNGTLKAGVERPFIPGHEVCGRVVARGRDARYVPEGARVATTQRSRVCGHCRYCRSAREPLCTEAEFMGDRGLNGGYAEFVRVAADQVALVPDGVADEAAAIASCAIGTALHAARAVAKVELGERVLVTGAGGGVGLHAVQVARAAGAVVIGLTTSPDKSDAIREAGAHHVVVAARGGDFSGQDSSGQDFSSEVRALAGGLGVDVALDTVGTPVFAPTRRSLAPGGRWVLIGQLTGAFVPFNPAQLFLRGVSMLSATSTTREELAGVLDLLDRGEIRAATGAALPLAEASRAHALLESGEALGRLTLRPAA